MCLLLSGVVSALGVKDQQNGLRQVPTLLHVVSFLWDWVKQKFSDQNRESLMNGNKYETLLSLSLYNAQGESSFISEI
jgi:hypothetical protein